MSLAFDFDYELILPVLGALIAGCLIGFERSFRGRPAGFRTHGLVCVACALLMVAAVHQVRWMGPEASDAVIRIDPVRMAHGILTGIGFLCGGVIFRDGFSVHGLTSAASLWMTSALGVLFGVAMYDLAIGGTIMAMAVLAGFRFIENKLPQQAYVDLRVRYRRNGGFTEDKLREAVKLPGVALTHVSHKLLEGGAAVEHSGTMRGFGRLDVQQVAKRLCEDAEVLEFELKPRSE